jgi:hypothetical protein
LPQSGLRLPHFFRTQFDRPVRPSAERRQLFEALFA